MNIITNIRDESKHMVSGEYFSSKGIFINVNFHY